MFCYMLFVIGVCCCFTTTQADVFPVFDQTSYNLTYNDAVARCHSRGGSLATHTDLELARQTGLNHCACGWLLDGRAAYPIAQNSGCNNSPRGLNFCNWRSTWDAYCFVGDPVGNCSRPLGMESGVICDNQVTTSSAHRSFWGGRWKASLARLNKQGKVNAWMPEEDSTDQYIQVDLKTPSVITGIITQGAKRYFHKQYVTQYIVSHSKDASHWRHYVEDSSGLPKVFSGNHDDNRHVRNMFRKPILARHIRIYPISWKRHITLRFELVGCDMATYDRAIREETYTPYI